MVTGELTKVEIRAFEDKEYKKQVGKFQLPINPEQFSQSFKVEYDSQQDQGSQGNNPKFKFTRPEELKLNFTFDGTGVVPNKKVANSFHKNVVKQVEEFLEIVYNIKGKTHKPNFLRLFWGDFSFGSKFSSAKSFDCILKDLQINYTLFAPDGKPLRAKLSATFVHYIEPKRRGREQGNSSPDLTHLRKVKAGDTLPLMTYSIYGDPSYYLQVAKVNNLINFRRLATNTDLRFPPIEKTKS